jgi:hypothetical protein
MKRLAFAVVAALLPMPVMAGPAFDISNSYTPRTKLVPGYYACRSGLDFNTFTFSFDVAADASYKVRGQNAKGKIVMSAANGTIDFKGGPFASDATAKTYARNTTRVSDGNAVIIIRYDFGNVVTDDYCARVK